MGLRSGSGLVGSACGSGDWGGEEEEEGFWECRARRAASWRRAREGGRLSGGGAGGGSVGGWGVEVVGGRRDWRGVSGVLRGGGGRAGGLLGGKGRGGGEGRRS